MKNVFQKLVVAIVLVSSIGVSAQDRKEKIKNSTPEERIEKRTEKLAEKLSLDENQKKKVKEILAAQQKENKGAVEELKAERQKALEKRKSPNERATRRIKSETKTRSN